MKQHLKVFGVIILILAVTAIFFAATQSSVNAIKP